MTIKMYKTYYQARKQLSKQNVFEKAKSKVVGSRVVKKNKNKMKTIFFAKILHEYKIRYLRQFGGIKVTGSAINRVLFRWGYFRWGLL